MKPTEPQNPTLTETETPKRKRAYAPRISKKEKANPLVQQKEIELRDARMLERLIAEIKDLSPWGLGQLKDAIKDLGPVQPDLLAGKEKP